jgi:glycine dehydrogenase
VHDEAQRDLEMLPVSWPEFGGPAPVRAARPGCRATGLFESLEARLCEITGFAAVSLQPNAGSQGEYAGLLVIRAYHRHRGEGHRTCA